MSHAASSSVSRPPSESSHRRPWAPAAVAVTRTASGTSTARGTAGSWSDEPPGRQRVSAGAVGHGEELEELAVRVTHHDGQAAHIGVLQHLATVIGDEGPRGGEVVHR